LAFGFPRVQGLTFLLRRFLQLLYIWHTVVIFMRKPLRRYYGRGDLHFLTFSCYRRLPLLKTARARNIFVRELGKVRDEMEFCLEPIWLC